MSRAYKVGSLFAGVGGICLGFKQANFHSHGYDLMWANEFDAYACETYRKNFSHTLLEGDITKILHPASAQGLLEKTRYGLSHKKLLEHRIDILTGGFPCQAFSVEGSKRGFEDERGNLFFSIVNLVEQLGARHGKPRVLFLENVKNLLAHDFGRTYSVILDELNRLGYTVKDCVLNTKDYSNLPQNRERIYIVCFLNKEDADAFTMFDHLSNFKLNHTREDREKEIKSILDYSDNVAERYFVTKEMYPDYFGGKDPEFNVEEQVTEMYQFYQIRRSAYIRKNKSNVCPTLMACANTPVIKTSRGVRKLTPAETFRLQGFPVHKGYKIPAKFKGNPYTDNQLYIQSGNSVSVPVIELIATEILKALVATDTKALLDGHNS